jgi:hypothetical protein
MLFNTLVCKFLAQTVSLCLGNFRKYNPALLEEVLRCG